jgi:uncharacterized protein (DUF2141 family)
MKYCWYLLLVILYSCANPVPPTGGPKDLDPPVLLNTIPENKSLNFDGSEISMEFDEYIKEENLLTQLMITPNLKGNYNYKVNRTRFVLTFEEPFDSATTYTLNFREGIKDITEGNVPPNLKFVFSTGTFLDSGSVRGTVRSLMNRELIEDITISLYQFPDTITVFDGPPRYSTITDEEGYFLIENIKNGTYSVFSINDENRNLMLESRTESYGFLDETVLINDSLPPFEMFIFNLDTRPIVLQSSRPIGNNYDIKFNKSLAAYRIVTENPILYSNLVDDNQTLRIYKTDLANDSLGLQFVVMDSIQQSLDTLVYVKFQESTRKSEDFNATVALKDGETNKDWKTTIKMNKPVARINYDSIYFRFDSLYSIPLTDSLFISNDSRDHFEISFDFNTHLIEDSIFSNWSSPFEFIIGEGSIISAENDSLKTIKRTYSFKEPKDYGVLRGTASSSDSSYIIQLIDKSFEVVDEIFVNSEIPYNYQFNHIEPGTYSIRVLVDENGNGMWDPGNILKRTLPESVHLFYHQNIGSQAINLRANWEQTGLDLTF